LAATADRQLADSEQQRNLRIRPRAEQFVVLGPPAVLLALQQRDAFSHRCTITLRTLRLNFRANRRSGIVPSSASSA
jgi:hypothetical protein